MWRLPIIYLWIFPVHVWLGMLLALLILLQMGVGKQIIKLNHFLWHRHIIPILILIVLFFHAWWGLSIWWPK